MKNGSPVSLGKRLRLLLVSCFVPFAVVAVFLLLMMYRQSRNYEAFVEKITRANEYNVMLKEQVDYTMYVVAVNSERASELVDTTAPHRLIEEATEDFSKLLQDAEDESAGSQLTLILKCLDSLNDSVTQLEGDAQISGMYDTNMERLDLDIRIMTELIQENIQGYINHEATNMQLLREKVSGQVKYAIIFSAALSLIALVVTLGISRKISESLTRGIHQLQNVTRKAGQGDFSVRAQTDDSDTEMAELENGFNHMVEKIGNLVEDIRVEQINQRLTEQKLLQAQINPHFLYNTLDTIIWQAEAGEKEQVIMMVSALSDFFRTTLSKGRDFITVAEEESHIRSYLQIQGFRYQDILQYEIRIPEEMYEYQILKLTLQPIVENALYHGIKNKRGLGHIWVSGELDGEVMVLRVRDDGMGMTPERLNQVCREMNGEETAVDIMPSVFGLYNVVERIHLNYGPEFGMTLSSIYGQGTEAVIRIPARKNIQNS